MPAEFGPAEAEGRVGLVQALRGGNLPALARAISVVENREPGFGALLDEARRGQTGGSHRIGITGPPGVGKSSLARELTRLLRAREEKVAVLAVDPSSEETGGALLGDRIRMGGVALDGGVYFRSMAARDALGGIATAAPDVLDLLDAAGFARLLVETVGVGQSERKVATIVHSVVVVLMPGQGDTIQVMKAGVSEIADLFVVNKAELAGADGLVRDLRDAVELRAPRRGGWKPPVLSTTADDGRGVDALLDALDRHRAFRSKAEASRETDSTTRGHTAAGLPVSTARAQALPGSSLPAELDPT